MILNKTLLVTLLIGVSVLMTEAATDETARTPDRFLVIVDISDPMRNRVDAVQASMLELLTSEMQGELRNGDEIGMWTFNDQLHMEGFSLTVWNEGARNEISRKIIEFLDGQRFSNASRFENVMPGIKAMVEKSHRITVILYSDGDDRIQGTPFDDEIASYFQEHVIDAKEKHVPFVTILRGSGGQFVGHDISIPPQAVEFPEFPPEPDASVAQQTPSIRATKAPRIVYAEPLIVSGRQPATTEADTPVTPASTDSTRADKYPAQTSRTQDETGAETTVSPPLVAAPATEPTPGSVGVSSVSNGAEVNSLSSAPSFWTPMKIVLALGTALILAGGLIFLGRRTAPKSHTSLITKSMDE